MSTSITVEDRMAEVYPRFCRRVCAMCNAEAKQILPECPIVKFDSFLYLMQTNNFATVSKLIADNVKVVVDADLIKLVATQSSTVSRMHSIERKESNEK